MIIEEVHILSYF